MPLKSSVQVNVSPLITVVMPVFNGEKYIEDAVDSVLLQTFKNFELLIVNDGSTDGTLDILNKYNDVRIKIINIQNNGLVHALNLGISLAKGKYIARMDSDDICFKNRFKIQIACFEQDHSVDIVSGNVIFIGENNENIGKLIHDDFTFKKLKNFLLYKESGKPIVHPTVMVKKDVIDTVKGYRYYHSCEDRDLWLRCIDRYKFVNLDEILLSYRVNVLGISHKNAINQIASGVQAVVNYEVKQLLDIDMYVDHSEKFKSIYAVLLLKNKLILSAISNSNKLRKSMRCFDYSCIFSILFSSPLSIFFVLQFAQRLYIRGIINAKVKDCMDYINKQAGGN
jgi:glycosyltransferase involved in cell wall biosynthesis